MLQTGEALRLEKGVLQGSPLSPLLSNLALDEALRSIRGRSVLLAKDGPKVGFGYLAYVDDLVANCPDQLLLKLNVLVLNAVCHLFVGNVIVEHNSGFQCAVGACFINRLASNNVQFS